MCPQAGRGELEFFLGIWWSCQQISSSSAKILLPLQLPWPPNLILGLENHNMVWKLSSQWCKLSPWKRSLKNYRIQKFQNISCHACFFLPFPIFYDFFTFTCGIMASLSHETCWSQEEGGIKVGPFKLYTNGFLLSTILFLIFTPT